MLSLLWDFSKCCCVLQSTWLWALTVDPLLSEIQNILTGNNRLYSFLEPVFSQYWGSQHAKARSIRVLVKSLISERSLNIKTQQPNKNVFQQ